MVVEKSSSSSILVLVVALGATAVQALAGKALPIARFRGPAEFDGHAGYIMVHPSYLLRIPDAEAKAAGYRDFVADLKSARALVDSSASNADAKENAAPRSGAALTSERRCSATSACLARLEAP